jgi:hypothetical protein
MISRFLKILLFQIWSTCVPLYGLAARARFNNRKRTIAVEKIQSHVRMCRARKAFLGRIQELFTTLFCGQNTS